MMDANHKFELLATVFHMTTGKMAPGKDDRSGTDDMTRRQIWEQWNKTHGEVNRAWLRCIEVQIENSQTEAAYIDMDQENQDEEKP